MSRIVTSFDPGVLLAPNAGNPPCKAVAGEIRRHVRQPLPDPGVPHQAEKNPISSATVWKVMPQEANKTEGTYGSGPESCQVIAHRIRSTCATMAPTISCIRAPRLLTSSACRTTCAPPPLAAQPGICRTPSRAHPGAPYRRATATGASAGTGGSTGRPRTCTRRRWAGRGWASIRAWRR
jgi:hypothetical protein